jgi:hypothetical protein
VKRAYVLLQADQSEEGPAWKDELIARTYQVSLRTIERLRQRFVEEGPPRRGMRSGACGCWRSRW